MIDIVSTQFELYSLSRTAEKNPEEALRRYRHNTNQNGIRSFQNEDNVTISSQSEIQALLNELHVLLRPKLSAQSQSQVDSINNKLHTYFNAFDQNITEGEFRKLESLQYQIEQLEFIDRPLTSQEQVHLQNLLQQEEKLIQAVETRLPNDVKVDVEELENQLHSIFADSFAAQSTGNSDQATHRIESEIDTILESALNDNERIRLDSLFSQLEDLEDTSVNQTLNASTFINKIDELERQISALFEKARRRLTKPQSARLESLTTQLEFQEAGLKLTPRDQARVVDITLRIESFTNLAAEAPSKKGATPRFETIIGDNANGENSDPLKTRHLISLQA